MAVEHPVVVVALAEHELLVVVADPLPDRVRRPEVERRARDRRERRRSGSASRRPACSSSALSVQPVVVDRPRALARQVPVRVVREVDHRRRVRRRLVVDAQVVVLVERVVDLDVEVAGVARAVGRLAGRCSPRPPCSCGSASRRPRRGCLIGSASHTKRSKPWSPPWRLFGPLLMSSVYVVAVERERRVGDAVAVAADDAAEVRRVRGRRVAARHRVAVEVRVAERDVREPPAAVGRVELLDDAAVA